jgi:hypothetical protein
MAMKIPELDYTASKSAVISNYEKIETARIQLKAELAVLDGLEAANQGLCRHLNKHAVYDPGYAGGGQDGYKCPDCRKRGYF